MTLIYSFISLYHSWGPSENQSFIFRRSSTWKRSYEAPAWTRASPAKREEPGANIEASTLKTVSSGLHQVRFTHLGRNLVQFFAHIERFSGTSEQRLRFDEVTRNAPTPQIHFSEIELRVGSSLVGRPSPQFDAFL